MIRLFRGNWSSTLIIAISIPLSILVSILCLSALGQTINIMTLGGLALAAGILVDEATVEIENIHAHLARREPLSRAVLIATRETITPRLLALLSILPVFAPSLFMFAVTRSPFIPLCLS